MEELGNARHPALTLDSVYGDGPTFHEGHRTVAADQYMGIKFRIGEVATRSTNPNFLIDGVRIPPTNDLKRDLPRVGRLAVIADSRNDESLIIAQLHLAFLRFHNNVVDWVRQHEADRYHDDTAVFGRARQLTRWTYQWVTLHDILPTVAQRTVVDDVLARGDARFAPRQGEVCMPLEFSVAGFRFGHSMVRDAYDFNRNFGKPGLANWPSAPFNLLFAFTGEGTLSFGPTPGPPTFAGSDDRLPFNWVIEWDRMTDSGTLDLARLARPVDTRIAPPLGQLAKEGNEPNLPADAVAMLKHLARRNLARGYLLSLPTGQAVARELGVPALTHAELQLRNTTDITAALNTGGFLDRTPLWYYLLKEAEVQTAGRSLGRAGSRLVAETIVGQVRHDPTSYLNQEHEWTPEQGVRLHDGRPVHTIADVLRFAGVLD